MTKQQLVAWLKNYTKAYKVWQQRQRDTDEMKKLIKKYQNPLQIEKKHGIVGNVISGALITLIATIPSALVFGVVWVVWDFVEIIKKDLKHNPGIEMLSIEIIERAAGIVIDDVPAFFIRHEILGPTIGCLIIGFAISLIIGLIAIIFGIISDKSIPKRNEQHRARFEDNQKMLAAAEVRYGLAKQGSDAAWNYVQKLKKESPIPNTYLDYAEEILSLLVNQRADTLKEALNILHDKWERQSELEEHRRHNKEMERQNAQMADALSRNAEAARQAAEAAEDAAYWEKKRYIDDIFDDLLK